MTIGAAALRSKCPTMGTSSTSFLPSRSEYDPRNRLTKIHTPPSIRLVRVKKSALKSWTLKKCQKP